MQTSAPKQKSKKPSNAVTSKPVQQKTKQKKRQQRPRARVLQSDLSKSTRGEDLRRTKPLPFANGNIVSGQSSSVTQLYILENDSLIQFAYGYVARLVEMGYGNPTGSDLTLSYPWYLTQVIVDQLLLAANGKKLTVAQIPKGLLNLCQALTPKNAPFKTGVAALAWDTSNIQSITVPYIYNNTDAGINFGVQSNITATSEGYPVIVSPAPYSPEVGDSAWNLMIRFLTSTAISPLTKIVDSSMVTKYIYDTSCFTSVYPQIGQTTTPRGYTTQLFSMHKIQSPIFSVFCAYINDTLVTTESRISAGGPRFLANRLLTMSDEDLIHNKVKPIFMPLDFDDLYDLVSTIMGTAAEMASKQNVTTFTIPTLSLTGLQVALMLRAVIAGTTNKLLGSDLVTDEFAPLHFPTSCLNVSTVIRSMILPFVVVENIRALSLVATKPVSGRGKGRNNTAFVYAPVWGTYRDSPRTDWDYVYNTNTPLYTPGGSTSLDIVSLTNNNGETISVTGDDLATAIGVWNTWINQFSAVLQLAQFSSSDNNPLLYCCLNQRGFSYNQQVVANALPSKRESKTIVPVFKYSDKLKQVRAVSPVEQTYVCERYIASNFSMDTPAYELYSQWVLPRLPVNIPEDVDRNCGNSIMPFRVITVGSKDNPQSNQPWFPELTKKWIAVASMSVYAPTGKPSEAVQVLWDATQKGEGGFLGSMLADFAATITGIPALSHLGSIIPF